MAEVAIDEKLRDMAEHRGLKLVKSRRRKPGLGDYGKFGLTDAAGKPLLGIGAKGLEASAQDIEAYLRASAASTWKTSAESSPVRSASKARPSGGNDGDDQDLKSAIRPRLKHSSREQQEPPSRGQSKGRNKAEDPKGRDKTGARQAASVRSASRPSARRSPPAPVPEKKLFIRAAKTADAEALVPLVRQLSGVRLDELGVARNLKAALKARAGMAVAELGELVGCCAWAVIPTIQHGLVGRLTLLLVAEAHRRKGIATALVDEAVTSLRKKGCTRLEAMSDIEVRNAHNFFRTLNFEQTSYRFVRSIDAE
ncbi:GNAT family N-acetyltransferase [Sphingobium yanoikuyae]|jgi:ribosomal protein S18 acetylase RimI-like enzyme|uniref:GNAT family N-acetyltransferase n=1 Tax=Sphingobium yanoikuyae TaxID=13690 RepID=UPI0013790573|nr:GNAT family N-acetyltransferase [Sphingobium yanoikuyae]NBB42280.1 GNAT family N-acetyltransferase [Sphingobium yanoikuyae]HEV7436632.1 GNAT family N-acetyltransferase [Pseudorhizobium sp.]